IQAPVQQKAITSPQHAYEHVKHFFVRQDQEQFIAVFLNTKKVPIHTHLIGIGTLDHITLHPRDILAKALACKASSLLLAHNHPSGDCEPSEEDITFTHQFVKLATFMGFEVCDHIIVGQHTFCSFMDKGLLE
ncbi:MAG: JAB domain-containing protein, partial [Candidatus Woesearchaeota archaeon]